MKYAFVFIYNFASASWGEGNRFDSENADILRTRILLIQKPHDGIVICSPKPGGFLCVKALQSITVW